MLPKRHWQEMTSDDVAAAPGGDWIAVLPVAAIEQHGPHLPLATDACIAAGLVAETIRRLPDSLPVTFLPLQSLGASDEHLGFPGTLSLSWSTLAATLMEIGASVARSGIRKLVVVNAHGGNSPALDMVARDLRIAHNLLAVTASWARFGEPDGIVSDTERQFGIHAGDIETSLMLHLRPDLVRMDRAGDFPNAQVTYADFTHLRAYGPVGFGWRMADLNPDGAAGNAAAAAAQKGRAILEHRAGAFVALLEDVHRFDISALSTS